MFTPTRYKHENDFDAIVATAAARYGVALPFVKAIIAVESGFTAAAQRGEPGGAVSYGLMQVTPAAAWGSHAGEHRGAELLDPATNVDRGVAFLASLLAQLDQDEARAASAYNGGVRPSIGFGARVTRDTTVCLAWKPDAPATGRTIAQHCASPFTAHAGQFGNQPYVDRVTAYRKLYTAGTIALTPDQAGAVAASALGVAVLVLLAAR